MVVVACFFFFVGGGGGEPDFHTLKFWHVKKKYHLYNLHCRWQQSDNIWQIFMRERGHGRRLPTFL